MNKNIVIAIGRQNGSGGREIGKKLADQLGIPFYDKQLIQMTAEKSGIHEDICQASEETATNSLLYTLSTSGNLWGGRMPMGSELPVTDRIFIAQSEIIKNLAKEQSCVIVGRCADDILRNNPNCIRVFIHADLKYRTERMVRLYGLSEEKAERQVIRMDKKRANYYNYFTDSKWGLAENYTLTLDSAQLGIDGCIGVLKYLVEQKRAALENK
ncbi:MAG: AAA family ATPase [Massiliimalia sp.]|jgi:cytidylate kinase